MEGVGDIVSARGESNGWGMWVQVYMGIWVSGVGEWLG